MAKRRVSPTAFGAISIGCIAVLAVSAPGVPVMISPESGGLSSLAVPPGGSFSLDLKTTGTGTIDSAVFTVEFSKPGLQFTGYTWGGGFSGSGFDGSTPASASLPATIGDMTYDTPGAVEKLDIYFDNFTTSPFTLGGTMPLVTLSFGVPSGFDYGTPPEVVVSVVADTFALSGVTVGAQGGQFILTPEPGSLALLATGALAALRFRRGRRELVACGR